MSEARWSPWHAGAMLLALGLAIAVGRAAPLAFTCAASLAGWVWLSRAAFDDVRAFGAANVVTSARVLLIAGLGITIDARGALACALCSLGIFTLDGVDGWLARRSGRASAFGARYDMETDACFVLILSVGSFQFGRAGAWVLLAGALRYLYVLTLWALRREQAEAPRSRVGRYGFALVVVTFTIGIWPAVGASHALAAVSTFLLTYSFGRSFYWSLHVSRPLNAPR